MYTFTDAGSSKIGPPLWQSEGASVIADCWIAGGQVYNDGNVWYHVPWIWRGTQSPDGNTQFVSAWVFGPYVDGAAAFHNHTLPNCSN
ncbi:hypothetical protein [Streptomyces melanogenes]|uniref:hypothetical protein n=1 Tax=Streptomyces melanogenes TaxID=67326 RepID=UPI0037BE00EA